MHSKRTHPSKLIDVLKRERIKRRDEAAINDAVDLLRPGRGSRPKRETADDINENRPRGSRPKRENVETGIDVRSNQGFVRAKRDDMVIFRETDPQLENLKFMRPRGSRPKRETVDES